MLNTLSGNISSKVRIASQRGLCRLGGGYLYSSGIHVGLDKSNAKDEADIGNSANEYLTTRAG
jgi:hypothetical protein